MPAQGRGAGELDQEMRSCAGSRTAAAVFDLARRWPHRRTRHPPAFRDKVADGALMARVICDIKNLILGEGHDIPDQDALHLWGEFDGHVAGSTNWANDLADGWTEQSPIGITGPDVPEHPVPW
jgi:CRISP-associated protein Cas1